VLTVAVCWSSTVDAFRIAEPGVFHTRLTSPVRVADAMPGVQHNTVRDTVNARLRSNAAFAVHRALPGIQPAVRIRPVFVANAVAIKAMRVTYTRLTVRWRWARTAPCADLVTSLRKRLTHRPLPPKVTDALTDAVLMRVVATLLAFGLVWPSAAELWLAERVTFALVLPAVDTMPPGFTDAGSNAIYKGVFDTGEAVVIGWTNAAVVLIASEGTRARELVTLWPGPARVAGTVRAGGPLNTLHTVFDKRAVTPLTARIAFEDVHITAIADEPMDSLAPPRD
jgi:hypothetical protein